MSSGADVSKVSNERRAVLNRLRSAQGHLRAVVAMVEEGKPCEEVLHQLDAIEAALCAAGRALWSRELQGCADIILHDPDPQVRAAEMQRFAALYGFHAKHAYGEESDG